jgi:type I restriction enzyme, S subunit
MEVKPGYKQTEVGVIPDEWESCAVRQKGEIVTGKALAVNGPGKQRPYLRTKNVFDGRIDIDDVLTMPMTDEDFAHFRIRQGDVLLNEGQSLELVGRCAMYQEEYPEPCAIQNQLIRFRPRLGVSGVFASYLFRHCQQSGVFARIALQTTSIAHLGGSRFGRLLLAWPKIETEQRAIGTALSDVDALIASLDQLIAKKHDLKQAAMQQLLTGKTRLPGLHGEWRMKRIADIASPKSEKNTAGEKLPVLTCSKHLGFMDSLGFFKNQVFSKDLSTYKVIRRGAIGYPANHVEEGSVGLQNLYDVALVSPIYVVFAVEENINSFFLHRLLKLDSYRQRFKAATTSSIDRRGSLRWRTFSEITVRVPSLPEQIAIAEVLSDMDAEIEALERRREKTRALKQGMMQELLTGRTRLL